MYVRVLAMIDLAQNSEDLYECSAIVTIVYASESVLLRTWQFPSHLRKSTVQYVHVLQCAVVVGCSMWWCATAVSSAWYCLHGRF